MHDVAKRSKRRRTRDRGFREISELREMERYGGLYQKDGEVRRLIFKMLGSGKYRIAVGLLLFYQLLLFRIFMILLWSSSIKECLKDDDDHACEIFKAL
jgi:hypothetical protein